MKIRCVPNVAKSKCFFNSPLVIFKLVLCSNHKLTAVSIVSLSGIMVNKLKTSQEIKNVVANTFFISSKNVNESFVQWDIDQANQ